MPFAFVPEFLFSDKSLEPIRTLQNKNGPQDSSTIEETDCLVVDFVVVDFVVYRLAYGRQKCEDVFGHLAIGSIKGRLSSMSSLMPQESHALDLLEPSHPEIRGAVDDGRLGATIMPFFSPKRTSLNRRPPAKNAKFLSHSRLGTRQPPKRESIRVFHTAPCLSHPIYGSKSSGSSVPRAFVDVLLISPRKKSTVDGNGTLTTDSRASCVFS